MDPKAAFDVQPPPAGGGHGPDEEGALWARWRSEGDTAARQKLLDLHLPYARVVAASYYAKRFNNEIEFGDYLQLASVGMVEAMERFDPAAGASFQTFSARRMHGAILNGIEHLTEKQQQIAARQRLQRQRVEAIKEVAQDGAQAGAENSGDADKLLKYVAEAGIAFALAWVLDGTGMVNRADQAETLPFYRSVELKQLRQRVLDIVNALPARQKTVIEGHYFEELPFEQIAKNLKLTRGRVSQIHREALLQLKKALRARLDCDVAW